CPLAAARRLAAGPLLLLRCFLSSRRRHTRFSRDWSSDVCSSDLTSAPDSLAARARSSIQPPQPLSSWRLSTTCAPRLSNEAFTRSEERRVGEEGRYGWSAATLRRHTKKAGGQPAPVRAMAEDADT